MTPAEERGQFAPRAEQQLFDACGFHAEDLRDLFVRGALCVGEPEHFALPRVQSLHGPREIGPVGGAAGGVIVGREFIVLGMLAIAVLAMGLWPAPLLEVTQVTVQHLVQQIAASKLPL